MKPTTPEERKRYRCGNQRCARNQPANTVPLCFECRLIADVEHHEAEVGRLTIELRDAYIKLADCQQGPERCCLESTGFMEPCSHGRMATGLCFACEKRGFSRDGKRCGGCGAR